MNYMIDVPLKEHRQSGKAIAVYEVGYMKSGASPLFMAENVSEAALWINSQKETPEDKAERMKAVHKAKKSQET